jgi:hypothetical protein
MSGIKAGASLPRFSKIFPSDEAATAHAMQLAASLAQESDWDGCVIEVSDESGRIVSHVPVGIGGTLSSGRAGAYAPRNRKPEQ